MSWEATQRVAKIYAEAIYALAGERQVVAVVAEDLRNLAALLNVSPSLEMFLESPVIGSEEKQAAVKRFFEGKVHALTGNFLGILAWKRRLHLIRGVCREYQDLIDKSEGRIQGLLVTAVALDPMEKTRFVEQIGRTLKAKLLLQASIDPDIIGGMILTLGDTVIDSSVRSQLKRFVRQLQQRTLPAAVINPF